MRQKRHVFEMFEITYFHPFRGLDIVLGRRDYHHSIRREISPRIGSLIFLLAQILNFSIFGPSLSISRSKHRGPLLFTDFTDFEVMSF